MALMFVAFDHRRYQSFIPNNLRDIAKMHSDVMSFLRVVHP